MIPHEHHKHETTEEYERCRKAERSGRVWAGVALVVLALLLLGADAAWNQWVYGDWRCAWAHCRKVEIVK